MIEKYPQGASYTGEDSQSGKVSKWEKIFSDSEFTKEKGFASERQQYLSPETRKEAMKKYGVNNDKDLSYAILKDIAESSQKESNQVRQTAENVLRYKHGVQVTHPDRRAREELEVALEDEDLTEKDANFQLNKLLQPSLTKIGEAAALSPNTGTLQTDYQDEYKGFIPSQDDQDDSIFDFTAPYEETVERDAPLILGGGDVQGDTSLVEGFIPYVADKVIANREAATEHAINVFTNLGIDEIDDLSAEGFEEDDYSRLFLDQKSKQDEYGPSVPKLPEWLSSNITNIYDRADNISEKYKKGEDKRNTVTQEQAAATFEKTLRKRLERQGIDIEAIKNNNPLTQVKKGLQETYYRGQRERERILRGETQVASLGSPSIYDQAFAYGSNTFEIYSTAAEMFGETWMQAGFATKAGLRSAADTLGFFRDAAEFAVKYTAAVVNYMTAIMGTTADTDKTIWYDLFSAGLHNRHVMFTGFHYWLSEGDKAVKQVHQYYTDVGISKAIGAGKELMDDIYKGLQIPKDQRNLFNQTVNFAADFFVPYGFLGATVRGGNIAYRNLQRSSLLYGLSKNTANDVNFATIMRPLFDFNVAGDVKNINVARALDVDRETLLKYKELNYSPEKIQKIVRGNLTDYRMAMGASAGYALGAAFNAHITQFKGYEEYNGVLPTLTGMAGALMHNQVTNPFRGGVSGWGGALLGPLVISLTNWKTVLNALKNKNIDPEEAHKMNFKGLVLRMRGWTGSDIKDMKKQAVLRGNEAILEVERIKKSIDKTTNVWEKNKLQEKLKSTKDKYIRSRVLKEDGTVNKYSVIEKNMNISREHTEFINKFKENLNKLAKTHPEQADEMRTALTKSFALFDKLETDFPKELAPFQIILSQALQSSVLQNMMTALSTKITASAKLGKWITDPSHLYELRKMDKVVRENILSLENVLVTLRKEQEAKVVSRKGRIAFPEEDAEFMVATQMVESLVDLVKRQQKGSIDNINMAKQILTTKNLPTKAVSEEEIAKTINSLGAEDRVRGLNEDELLLRREDISRIFDDKYIENKKRVDALFDSLKSDDTRELNATDFMRIIQDSKPIFGPGNPLSSKYKLVERKSLQNVIESVEGENLLEKVENYYGQVLRGSEFQHLEEAKFAPVVELLAKGFKASELSDKDKFAKDAINKLNSILSEHEGVGKVIKVSDYKEARKTLADSVAKAYRSGDMKQWNEGKILLDRLDNFAENQKIDVEGLKEARKEWQTYVLPFFEKGNPLAQIRKSRDISTDPNITEGAEKSFNMIVSAKNPEHARLMFDRFFGIKLTDLAKSKDKADRELFKRLFPSGNIPKGRENELVYDEKIIQYLSEAIGDSFYKGGDLRLSDPNDLTQIRRFLMNFEDVFDNVIKMGDTGYRVRGESAFKESIGNIRRYVDSVSFESARDVQTFREVKSYATDVIESVKQRSIIRYGSMDESKAGQDIFSIVANKLHVQGKLSSDDIYEVFIKGSNNSVTRINNSMTKLEFDEFLKGVITTHSTNMYNNLRTTRPELSSEQITSMVEIMTNTVRKNLEDALHVNKYNSDIVYINPTEFLINQMKSELSPEEFIKFNSSIKTIMLKKLQDAAFPTTDLTMVHTSAFGRFSKKTRNLVNKFLGQPTEAYMKNFEKAAMKGDPDALAILKKLGIDTSELQSKVNFKLQPDLDIVSFRQFVDEHSLAMKGIFGEEHIRVIEDIFQLGVLTKGKLSPAGASLSAVATEYTVPMILGRVHAIARGVLSPRYLIMEMAVSHHRQTKFLVMREILQDEKFARSLHDVMTKQRPSDYSKAYFARKLATLSTVAHIKTLRDFDKTEEESVSWEPVYDVNELVSKISGINRDFRKSEFGPAGSQGRYTPKIRKPLNDEDKKNMSDILYK